MTAELNLMYLHGESIGYGRLGVYLARELDRHGVDVYDHLLEPGDGLGEYLNNGRKAKRCSTVCWISVPTHARGWWVGQHPMMFTMWESTYLPESFRETLHQFDRIIVPSQQNVELFSQYHPDVRYVPLGVDPDEWHFVRRTPPEQQFRFLIGGSGSRKGTDLAYRAFRTVFKTWPKDGPVPTLVMKSPRGEDFHGDRIEIVPGKLSPEAERGLYATAHCYLQPSRGEGFGLQPLQAIAQGMPTILTDAHGHAAFSHLGYGLSTTPTQSAYFIYGDAKDWWEPDFGELCEHMEYVYENWERAEAVAEENSRRALAEFTWAHTARHFTDAVGWDNLTSPYTGPDEWFTPEVRRYLLRVKRRWAAEIAGASYQFEPGRDYWELADVKRILFEAGVLDPSCLDLTGPDDVGLTDAQVRRIADYTAAHAFCWECGQQLGTGVTRADVEFDRLVEASG